MGTFPGQGLGIHEDEQTLAQMLKDAGYRTMHIGKWHCGDQPGVLPTNRGFDAYYGLPYSNDMGRQAQIGSPHKMLADAPPLPLMYNDEVIEEQPDQNGLTERYTEQAVRFLRENKDAPFFLYLAHMHVHRPLYAAQRFLQESRDGRYGACVEAIDWSLGVLLH